MRIGVALLVLVAACGRIGFDSAAPEGAVVEDDEPAGGTPGPGPDGNPGPSLDAAPGDATAAACSKPDIGCAGNEYCGTPLGMCNASGTCQAIPSPSAMCPDVVVCGCDGMQYSTPCAAARAKQSVQSLGPCPI